jgi:DNA primase catalytic core
MARIADAELDRLKSEVSLVRLIESAGYTLVKQGRDLAMRCPFHEGDDTPSFIVTPAKNVWHCFGCQTGGTVIDWTMRREGVSFRHAVERLREGAFAAAGAVPVKQSTVPQLSPPVAFDADDDALLAQVVDYYHATLKQAPEGRAYLASRGLDHPDLIDTFRLGLANRTLGLRLPEKNRVAGADIRTRLQRIGVYRENGREHFNGSLVIPVFDASGAIGEVYGRKLLPDNQLRPGTARHLYLPGPHRGVFNRDGWRGSDEVILCEALLDALTFWCAGYRHVTSAFGVSGFTDELLGAFVEHGVRRVLIAYDRDEAGDMAAKKLAPLLAQHGIAPYRVLFPKGMDANAYAMKLGPPAKALGVALRSAAPLDEIVTPSLNEASNHAAGRGDGPGMGAHERVGGESVSDDADVAGRGDGRAAGGVAQGDAVRLERAGAGAPLVAPEHAGVPALDGCALDRRGGAVAGGGDAAVSAAAHGGAVDGGTGGIAGRRGAAGSLATSAHGAHDLPVVVLPLAAAPEPCSPAPSIAQEIEAQVRDHDVVLTFGDRRYRVRGLEKNLAFDVLRVNVLASHPRGMHVDTFDLYQAKARSVFVKQAHVELGVDESVIQRDLGQVLLKLETLQEAQIAKATAPQTPSVPVLSAQDHTSALALLRDPQLADRIVADFARIGLIGEPTNALAGYLAAVSRKLAAPLAIIVQSTSAAGKSALMDAVLKLVPDEDRVHYSAMTGQSLFYLGEKDLKHKILAIAEEEGVRQAAYALKLLQSQGELTIASTGKDPTTGMLTTQEYRVEGPVMLFLTTTAIDIDEELLNRCLVLTINESREQTRAIQSAQRAKRTLAGLLADSDADAVTTLHRNAQRLLRPLAVVNPYAERLSFLDERTRTRRDHAKYLTLIDTIALLHQHQRPIQQVEHRGAMIEYIEATLEDIALANRLAHEVLGRSLDELPPQTRHLLGVLDALVRERMERDAFARADVRLTRQEIRHASGLSDTRLRLHLDRLVDMEYLTAHSGRQGRRFVYELVYDGPLDAEGPRLSGLIDVDLLRGTTGTSPGSVGDFASRSPAVRPSLAPSSPGAETARTASAGAASSLVAALAPENPPLGPRSRSHRNGRAIAVAP